MSRNEVALAILLLPAAGALLLALGAQVLPRPVTALVGPGVVWAAFAMVLITLAGQLQDPTTKDFTYWTWIQVGSFRVPFDLTIDNLSVFMGLVVTGIGGLIVTYSVGYMAHENNPGFARFFCYMDLFIFSMLLLVLAGNLVFLLVGWALVGLSSFLLIGFWYEREAAVAAARKAFVMNVIGDIGIILAIFVLWFSYHQVTYGGLFPALPGSDQPALELAGFLLLVGGIAKSAQLPLHTWLPDAMEGPTPVSALIHAATMVTAGVYLVGRMHPLYDVAAYAHATVAVIGAASALFAATLALVQTDIKRVLAYSTMSQIGYMFVAVGIGAYSAGFFHLLSHAFFKALLFMGAGSVIHAMHDEQDIRRYGGLWNRLRLTSAFFLVGALSLVGIIPLIGFWSKEGILGETLARPGAFHLGLWGVGFLTALLTALYTGRLWWTAFGGRPSPTTPVQLPHEAPPIMQVPVGILALGTVLGGVALQVNALFPHGWALVDAFLAPVVGQVRTELTPTMLAATAATVLLSAIIFLAGRSRWERRGEPDLDGQARGLRRLLEQKYFVDRIYDSVFVRSLDRAARAGAAGLERPVLVGVTGQVAEAAQGTAHGISAIQTGYFRTYVVVFGLGTLLAATVVVLRVLS